MRIGASVLVPRDAPGSSGMETTGRRALGMNGSLAGMEVAIKSDIGAGACSAAPASAGNAAGAGSTDSRAEAESSISGISC